MNPKAKKSLLICGIALDVAITVFLLVIAIIMLATFPHGEYFLSPEELIARNGAFIGGLQAKPTLYLLTCVLPLFVLLAVNIIGLVMYVKKAGKTKATLAELSDEQKAALKAELLKEMSEETKE